jgi:hypothetical protein
MWGCPAPAPAGGGGCFSATSTVQVLGKGSVQMQHLKVGDQVRIATSGFQGFGGEGGIQRHNSYYYQAVYAFGQHNSDALVDFHIISTRDDNNKEGSLEITGEHLVYIAGKKHPVRADSLKVGDVLLGTSQAEVRVTAIGLAKKQGLYSPLTQDGSLVVNGIAVSTYVALQEGNPEHYRVGPLNLLSHQSFVDLYLTPFRMMCMGVSPSLCQVYDADGLPHYISFGMKLVLWVGKQSALVQLLFLLLSLPILVFLGLLEWTFGSSLAALVLFGMSFIAARVVTKNKFQKPKLI